MRTICIALWDQAVEVRCPESIAADIELAFRSSIRETTQCGSSLRIQEEPDGTFSISGLGQETIGSLTRGDLMTFVMEAVVRGLVTNLNSAVALHAGAVAWNGRALLVAGSTGVGKSSLVAWFTDRQFDYITDEIAFLLGDGFKLLGFPRALVLKPGSLERVQAFDAFKGAATVPAGNHTLLSLSPSNLRLAASTPAACGLIVFPQFASGSDLGIYSMSAAEAATQLVTCNLNARNLRDGGFAAISQLARSAPAISLQYGDFEQLHGTVDVLCQMVLDSPLEPASKRQFLRVFPRRGVQLSDPGRPPEKRYPVPQPTPRRSRKKLAIGMATYDDYDGVYFSVQALRLYHPEVADDLELLVIDNHPDGACAEPLKQLDTLIPNYRYVPLADRSGTAIRDSIFREADSEFVLCMDSHVFLVPGALARLSRYFAENPNTNDLLQGPLLYDDLASFATHFEPVWRDGMYGSWAKDERADDPDGPPFEIPMQGLGLFACRRAAWPGFNPRFRGFGGEEGYIHEKFRRRGGRVLCLPFLRWVHRFQRPHGLPYVNRWEDRIRNYIIGFRELELPTSPVKEHFRQLIGAETVDRILHDIAIELGPD